MFSIKSIRKKSLKIITIGGGADTCKSFKDGLKEDYDTTKCSNLAFEMTLVLTLAAIVLVGIHVLKRNTENEAGMYRFDKFNLKDDENSGYFSTQ